MTGEDKSQLSQNQALLNEEFVLEVRVADLMTIIGGLDMALKHPVIGNMEPWASAAKDIVRRFYTVVQRLVPAYPCPQCLQDQLLKD